MKCLLLPLIATITLPTAINAESYSAGVARRQLPHMDKLLENISGFVEIRDFNAACRKLREYDILVEMNFEGLQEVRPYVDWFALKKQANMMIKKYC